MSEHYITCARCNKDLVITKSSDCYTSDIDNQLICKECFLKEQPKELAKQLTELKAENLSLQEQSIRDNQNWIAETTELQQQLKEKDELLNCYQTEEIKIANILGDKDLTIIGSRCHLDNLIKELRNKLKEKDDEIYRTNIDKKYMQEAIDDMCKQVDANCYDDFDDCLKEFVDKKLKEKDEEIEKLKKSICDKCRSCIQKSGYIDCAFRNFDNEQCGDLETVINEYVKKSNFYNTKQVCEKIREKSIKNYTINNKLYTYSIEPEILDQIEKGESNAENGD